MIKYLIFDFGGVILKHSPTITVDIIEEIFPKNVYEVTEIWNEYKILVSKGEKSSDDFLNAVIDKGISTSSIKELHIQWESLYKKYADGVDWELLDLIESLKAKYETYLFTDTIDVHDEYNKTRGIYEKFNRVFKSFEEGVVKAEGKQAFVHVLEKLKVNPEEGLFIDDLENNIKTAESLGIKGIVFKNTNQLKEELKILDIKV